MEIVKKKNSNRRDYLKKNMDIFSKLRKKIMISISLNCKDDVIESDEIKNEIEEVKLKNIITDHISPDLLVAKLLSYNQVKEYGRKLGVRLRSIDLDLASTISEEIVIFLVSVAYYEDFSKGGYWKKVFEICRIKYNQKIYLFLTDVIKDTLEFKNLYIAKDTHQWAYNTIIAHAIVPIEADAFFKFLDLVYSFYTTLESNIEDFTKKELTVLIKDELMKASDSYIFLKGTKLAIENCIETVIEYFYEVLKYIDILDSQKIDISELSPSIKKEIKRWHETNMEKGFYNVGYTRKTDTEEEEREILNVIRSLKFKLKTDRVDVETPKISLNHEIYNAYVKIGEQKYQLGVKKTKTGSYILPKVITKKTFDFSTIKLYIDNELSKEWKNDIVFLKNNGSSLKVAPKDNIYELDNRRIKILFNSQYEFFSNNSKNNNEVYCISGNIMFANLYLHEEIYYLKKGNKVIIIKNKLQEEEPEIIHTDDMIIKNIKIEGKEVLNKHPNIFIPYTDSEKYRVFINDNPIDVNAGINSIKETNPGKYEIKISKGIKNTKASKIIRKAREYFYFKDLSIMFYNEDGDKEYLYSHRDRKPIGNYNFDSEGISEVYYNGEKIINQENTFDLFIDNNYNRDFNFTMKFNGINYNAHGQMRVLEWSLDGKEYFSEYNKNILYKDIRGKKLYIRMEGMSEDVTFYLNRQKIYNMEKNVLDFAKLTPYFNDNKDDVIIQIKFKLFDSNISHEYKESLFKIRQNTKVKNIYFDREKNHLNVQVRGELENLVLTIMDSDKNSVYQENNLNLSNKIPIEFEGPHTVKIEKIDDFSFGFDDEVIYEKQFLF